MHIYLKNTKNEIYFFQRFEYTLHCFPRPLPAKLATWVRVAQLDSALHFSTR